MKWRDLVSICLIGFILVLVFACTPATPPASPVVKLYAHRIELQGQLPPSVSTRSAEVAVFHSKFLALRCDESGGIPALAAFLPHSWTAIHAFPQGTWHPIFWDDIEYSSPSYRMELPWYTVVPVADEELLFTCVDLKRVATYPVSELETTSTSAPATAQPVEVISPPAASAEARGWWQPKPPCEVLRRGHELVSSALQLAADETEDPGARDIFLEGKDDIRTDFAYWTDEQCEDILKQAYLRTPGLESLVLDGEEFASPLHDEYVRRIAGSFLACYPPPNGWDARYQCFYDYLSK